MPPNPVCRISESIAPSNSNKKYYHNEGLKNFGKLDLLARPWSYQLCVSCNRKNKQGLTPKLSSRSVSTSAAKLGGNKKRKYRCVNDNDNL